MDAWSRTTLLPVEQLYFQSGSVKIGRFHCESSSDFFPVTEPIFHDCFVFTRTPLWWTRDGGQYRFLDTGSVVLHRSGGSVGRRPSFSGREQSDWFAVRSDVYRDILALHGLEYARVTRLPLTVVTNAAFRLNEFGLIHSLDRSAPVSSLQVEEEVIGLFEQVCRTLAERTGAAPRNERRATPARRSRAVDRAREFIAANLATNVKLDEIAAAANVSSYHLCRIFKRETGMSLSQYRTLQRLTRGLERLSSGRPDLEELANELGFSSHSHFTNAFRTQFGAPPSRIRRHFTRHAALLS